VKVAAMFGDRKAGLVEKPDPTPKEDFVLVKVHAAPMCTEYKGFERGAKGDHFGHEAAGEVVEVAQPGQVKVGDEIEIIGMRDDTHKTIVTGVEMFRKTLDEGIAGDNIGCLLRGIDRDEVERGQVLAKPGSIKPHTRFLSEVYVLKKEEGGRHTPFFSGYRPQFYIRTMDVTGAIELPEGVEMVMPGDSVQMRVNLIVPVALESGSRFAIREGGRTVGAGVVTKVVQ